MVRSGNQPPGKQERAAKRRLEALELRQRGLSFRKIAVALGISVGQAHQDVSSSLSRLAELELAAAEDSRRLYLERMDAVIAGHFGAATSGDCRSAHVLLAAMDRGARLLGLYTRESQGPGRSDLSLYLEHRYNGVARKPDPAEQSD